MELSANEHKALIRTVDGVDYARYALKTRFVNIGDNYLDVIREYGLPYFKDGDMLSISEKIIALCQQRIVKREDIHPGFWAKFLCKLVHQTPAGPGAGTPYKMQLVIMQCGLPRVLLATVCAAFTKIFGIKGVFYKVCGHEVDGIDGLIDYDISFKEYVNYGILNPENPDKVCNEIASEFGIPCMIIDCCDISCTILGKSDNMPFNKDKLVEFVKDNPSGQDDQCTPLILIRKQEDKIKTDNKNSEN